MYMTMWQLMFIIDYVFCSNFIFMIIYKYFYDNFYLIYIAIHILYVWQVLCTELLFFFCDNLCIIYSNLLWDLILTISLHRTQRNRVRTKKIKKIRKIEKVTEMEGKMSCGKEKWKARGSRAMLPVH